MNTITVYISEENYFKIPEEYRLFMQIKYVEPKEYDYSGDDQWKLLKKESKEIYKKLKKVEYEIRMK